MSLTDTIRAGVETAFSVGSEFVSVGTYLQRIGEGTYDPDADTVAPGLNPVYNVRFLKTSSDIREREASPVAINDVKFLIPFVDLPDISPGDNDQILVDGTVYNVILSKFVPGQALHIVFGRLA